MSQDGDKIKKSWTGMFDWNWRDNWFQVRPNDYYKNIDKTKS